MRSELEDLDELLVFPSLFFFEPFQGKKGTKREEKERNERASARSSAFPLEREAEGV